HQGRRRGMTPFSLELIAAVSSNGVIGRAGQLPWNLPDDLRHFKSLTTGHPVIMGRRTFESIGRPPPTRRPTLLRPPLTPPAPAATSCTTRRLRCPERGFAKGPGSRIWCGLATLPNCLATTDTSSFFIPSGRGPPERTVTHAASPCPFNS